MFESSEDIVLDLDATVDRLLENAKALEAIAGNPFFTSETDALTRAQESLLAHAMNMQALLENEKLPKRMTPHVEKIERKLKTVHPVKTESSRVRRSKKTFC